MPTRSPGLPDRVSGLPTAKYVFASLLLLLFVLALGHLFLFDGLTARYYGLPLWLWLEIPLTGVMIAVAWYAIRLVTMAVAEDH